MKFKPKARASLPPEVALAIQDKRIILSVGRLGRRKGHDNLIRALPQVLSQVPNVIYLIAGSGIEERDIYYGRVIESLISENKIQRFVKILGEVSDEQLIALYNACDVFVMPSREIPAEGDIEGFGIAYLEANACGKPVVAGNSGGVADAVEDTVTGILVDPESPDEIARAIVRLLTDHRFRLSMGKAGRNRVVKEFQWTHTVDRLIEKMMLFENSKRVGLSIR